MGIRRLLIPALASVLFYMLPGSVNSFADEGSGKLNEHLAVFEPLIGKTWKGHFANSTTENPMIDVSRWERILNGNGIRITHSVNDGVYGGESILMWDRKQNQIACWYFTTAGFYTQSVFKIEGSQWSAIEDVVGNENGITKVRSNSHLLENGDLHVKSEYYANEKWTPGHEIHYKPAPEAEVKFK